MFKEGPFGMKMLTKGDIFSKPTLEVVKLIEINSV